MVSREENSDVFSRLGAGTQDPTPGGKIRICTEKVKNRTNVTNFFQTHIVSVFLLQLKAGSPLQCTYVVEGHSSSVLSVQVNENKLYTGAAGMHFHICMVFPYSCIFLFV